MEIEKFHNMSGVSTCSGDDPLHKHTGFLQAVDGETSKAGS